MTKPAFKDLKVRPPDSPVGTITDPRKDLQWNDTWRVTGKNKKKIDGLDVELVTVETERRLEKVRSDAHGNVISRQVSGDPAARATDIPYEWFSPVEPPEPDKAEAPKHDGPATAKSLKPEHDEAPRHQQPEHSRPFQKGYK